MTLYNAHTQIHWAHCILKSFTAAITCTRDHRNLFSTLAAFPPPPPLPTRRVVITGLGLVTPLGVGVQRVWDSLIAGHTAVRALLPDDLPADHRHAFPALPSKVIARVPRVQLLDPLPGLPATAIDLRRDAPFVHFAVAAAAEALQDAGWTPSSSTHATNATNNAFASTGVAIGAGMSCTTDMAEAGALLKDGKLRRLSPFFVPRTLVNMAAGAVSMAFGLQGPNHAASTACASGAHGIGDAFRMVQRGDADVMVAGGTESCVDAIALGGFARLKALSTKYNDTPHLASRPFDRERDGFVLGEGAGVVVLEDLDHAVGRGARIYAEIRGYGMSGDAFHITQPPPDGAGAALAMRRALASAGVGAEDVGYINAHATSTPIGDAVEQRAIDSVFRCSITDSSSTSDSSTEDAIKVSSTKGAIGHLLGAAGAVEAIFTILAMYHKIIPPNCNLEREDDDVVEKEDGEEEVVGNGASATRTTRTTRTKAATMAVLAGRQAEEWTSHRLAALSNSFGFGGTNASLVFGPAP